MLLSSFPLLEFAKVLPKVLLKTSHNKVITKVIKTKAQMDFDYR